jgi:hypothetical protein
MPIGRPRSRHWCIGLDRDLLGEALAGERWLIDGQEGGRLLVGEGDLDAED